MGVHALVLCPVINDREAACAPVVDGVRRASIGELRLGPLSYTYTYTILDPSEPYPTGEHFTMPNKTIYVADADVPLFEKAQALAGGNLSAAIAHAIRQYVAASEPEGGEGAGAGEVILTVTENDMPVKKRFRGRLLATQRVKGGHGASEVQYRVYQSEKGRFVVWSRTSPNYSGEWWRARSRQPGGWDGEWWRGESRLDIFDTVEDLPGNIPEVLYARVLRVVETGSEIEDLDI